MSGGRFVGNSARPPGIGIYACTYRRPHSLEALVSKSKTSVNFTNLSLANNTIQVGGVGVFCHLWLPFVGNLLWKGDTADK